MIAKKQIIKIPSPRSTHARKPLTELLLFGIFCSSAKSSPINEAESSWVPRLDAGRGEALKRRQSKADLPLSTHNGH